jgi:hypothetical protein
MKRLLFFGACALSLLALAPANASADAPVATYEVTITNLTSGQPFTPPVVAVHRASTGVFEAGDVASPQIVAIAENGNIGLLEAALADDKHVAFQASAGAPLVPAGLPGSAMFSDQVTLTVTGERGAKYFSWASMLICTNDGFTGVDTLRLPQRVGESVAVTTQAYDAGSELNTEDFVDIVPPCQGLVGVSSDDPGTGVSNPALAENGVITHHAGIVGGIDLLPDVHGWDDPVAHVEIVRVG